MVYAQPSSSLGDSHTHKPPLGLRQTNGSLNLGQKKRPNNNQQKNLQNCEHCCTGWSQNGSKRKDRYLDLARELRKLWNMKVTIITILIGALGTVTKGLLKGLEDLKVGARVETILTTALLRTARILIRVLETCCHSNSSEIPSAYSDVKNSQRVNNRYQQNNKITLDIILLLFSIIIIIDIVLIMFLISLILILFITVIVINVIIYNIFSIKNNDNKKLKKKTTDEDSRSSRPQHC